MNSNVYQQTELEEMLHLERVSHPPELILAFDGGCQPNPGSKYGSYVMSMYGKEVLRRQRFGFGHGTCNEAEFNALQLGLDETMRYLEDRHIEPSELRLRVLTDSTIIRNRLVGKGRLKVFKENLPASRRMIEHAERCRAVLLKFEGFEVVWQPRNQNVERFGH